jgi:hypothetical protein
VPDALQELADRRAIRELKGRYFRLVDANDWDAWRALFTDDVHVELPDAARTFDDADAFVAFVRETTEGARTVRQGHAPELTIDGPTDAHGTWALSDYDEWPPDPDSGVRRGWEGFGRYDETYRKVDGGWRISGLRVTYTRMDPLPREPLADEAPDVPLRSFGSEDPPAPAEATAQELLDIELISELKARYFRLVMAQDWEGFRRVFTDDARIDLADEYLIDGADNFVAAVRGMLAGAQIAIHGHTPEITIDSPTEARGAWAITEYVEHPPDPETGERRGFKGYGYERETYRKVDGVWHIASMRLNYDRFDPLPREPLPERIAGLQS